MSKITEKNQKQYDAGKIIFFIILSLFMVTGCSKLQWSDKAFSNFMSWEGAFLYCQHLKEGGHNDWRMPDIDELRTLIQNCPKTETGGECKVSKKNECLSANCLFAEDNCSCRITEKNNGYYSKVGDSDFLWSYTIFPENLDYRFGISFREGGIGIGRSGGDASVRCVRKKSLFEF